MNSEGSENKSQPRNVYGASKEPTASIDQLEAHSRGSRRPGSGFTAFSAIQTQFSSTGHARATKNPSYADLASQDKLRKALGAQQEAKSFAFCHFTSATFRQESKGTPGNESQLEPKRKRGRKAGFKAVQFPRSRGRPTNEVKKVRLARRKRRASPVTPEETSEEEIQASTVPPSSCVEEVKCESFDCYSTEDPFYVDDVTGRTFDPGSSVISAAHKPSKAVPEGQKGVTNFLPNVSDDTLKACSAIRAMSGDDSFLLDSVVGQGSTLVNSSAPQSLQIGHEPLVEELRGEFFPAPSASTAIKRTSGMLSARTPDSAMYMKYLCVSPSPTMASFHGPPTQSRNLTISNSSHYTSSVNDLGVAGRSPGLLTSFIAFEDKKPESNVFNNMFEHRLCPEHQVRPPLAISGLSLAPSQLDDRADGAADTVPGYADVPPVSMNKQCALNLDKGHELALSHLVDTVGYPSSVTCMDEVNFSTHLPTNNVTTMNNLNNMNRMSLADNLSQISQMGQSSHMNMDNMDSGGDLAHGNNMENVAHMNSILDNMSDATNSNNTGYINNVANTSNTSNGCKVGDMNIVDNVDNVNNMSNMNSLDRMNTLSLVNAAPAVKDAMSTAKYTCALPDPSIIPAVMGAASYNTGNIHRIDSTGGRHDAVTPFGTINELNAVVSHNATSIFSVKKEDTTDLTHVGWNAKSDVCIADSVDLSNVMSEMNHKFGKNASGRNTINVMNHTNNLGTMNSINVMSGMNYASDMNSLNMSKCMNATLTPTDSEAVEMQRHLYEVSNPVLDVPGFVQSNQNLSNDALSAAISHELSSDFKSHAEHSLTVKSESLNGNLEAYRSQDEGHVVGVVSSCSGASPSSFEASQIDDHVSKHIPCAELDSSLIDNASMLTEGRNACLDLFSELLASNSFCQQLVEQFSKLTIKNKLNNKKTYMKIIWETISEAPASVEYGAAESCRRCIFSDCIYSVLGFWSGSDLAKHIVIHHSTRRTLTCEFCYRHFSRRKTLEKHESGNHSTSAQAVQAEATQDLVDFVNSGFALLPEALTSAVQTKQAMHVIADSEAYVDSGRCWAYESRECSATEDEPDNFEDGDRDNVTHDSEGEDVPYNAKDIAGVQHNVCDASETSSACSSDEASDSEYGYNYDPGCDEATNKKAEVHSVVTEVLNLYSEAELTEPRRKTANLRSSHAIHDATSDFEWNCGSLELIDVADRDLLKVGARVGLLSDAMKASLRIELEASKAMNAHLFSSRFGRGPVRDILARSSRPAVTDVNVEDHQMLIEKSTMRRGLQSIRQVQVRKALATPSGGSAALCSET